MHQQLESRLNELKAEFEKGQQRLQELETEATSVRNTLLRISGAVQVLGEELERFKQASNGAEAKQHVS
jgi:predicted nuclease with TOPRIM domain